jgi:hypothetical protein
MNNFLAFCSCVLLGEFSEKRTMEVHIFVKEEIPKEEEVLRGFVL